MSEKIEYQVIGSYRGVDVMTVRRGAQFKFVIWLDKLYSSESTTVLYDLVDAWWKLRAN